MHILRPFRRLLPLAKTALVLLLLAGPALAAEPAGAGSGASAPEITLDSLLEEMVDRDALAR